MAAAPGGGDCGRPPGRPGTVGGGDVGSQLVSACVLHGLQDIGAVPDTPRSVELLEASREASRDPSREAPGAPPGRACAGTPGRPLLGPRALLLERGGPAAQQRRSAALPRRPAAPVAVAARRSAELPPTQPLLQALREEAPTQPLPPELLGAPAAARSPRPTRLPELRGAQAPGRVPQQPPEQPGAPAPARRSSQPAPLPELPGEPAAPRRSSQPTLLPELPGSPQPTLLPEQPGEPAPRRSSQPTLRSPEPTLLPELSGEPASGRGHRPRSSEARRASELGVAVDEHGGVLVGETSPRRPGETRELLVGALKGESSPHRDTGELLVGALKSAVVAAPEGSRRRPLPPLEVRGGLAGFHAPSQRARPAAARRPGPPRPLPHVRAPRPPAPRGAGAEPGTEPVGRTAQAPPTPKLRAASEAALPLYLRMRRAYELLEQQRYVAAQVQHAAQKVKAVPKHRVPKWPKRRRAGRKKRGRRKRTGTGRSAQQQTQLGEPEPEAGPAAAKAPKELCPSTPPLAARAGRPPPAPPQEPRRRKPSKLAAPAPAWGDDRATGPGQKAPPAASRKPAARAPGRGAPASGSGGGSSPGEAAAPVADQTVELP